MVGSLKYYRPCVLFCSVVLALNVDLELVLVLSPDEPRFTKPRHFATDNNGLLPFVCKEFHLNSHCIMPPFLVELDCLDSI